MKQLVVSGAAGTRVASPEEAAGAGCEAPVFVSVTVWLRWLPNILQPERRGYKTVQGKLRRLCVIQSAALSAADEAGILQASAFLSDLKWRRGEASASLQGSELHM